MEFVANEGKRVEIEAEGETYLRHAIRTHFVTPGESYIRLMERYVTPLYRPGDLVSISEKVIALCQNRIVTEEECRPGLWARLLSRCVHQTEAGPGMGLPVKMQFAINHCGLGKVLWAAVCAAVGKVFGKRGVFYAMLGTEVAGLDGFYGEDIPAYAHMGVRVPRDPDGVCNEIEARLGVRCMIVDANDLGQEILGRSGRLDLSEALLRQLIRDNPAGQGRQCTPFILIRKKAAADAAAS